MLGCQQWSRPGPRGSTGVPIGLAMGPVASSRSLQSILHKSTRPKTRFKFIVSINQIRTLFRLMVLHGKQVRAPVLAVILFPIFKHQRFQEIASAVVKINLSNLKVLGVGPTDLARISRMFVTWFPLNTSIRRRLPVSSICRCIC